MAAVFIVAYVSGRQWSAPITIGLAAFVILVWQPTSLFSPSFQLSFAAVISIAAILPKLKSFLVPPLKEEKTAWLRPLHSLVQWGLASLLISVAATAGTAPLSLIHFNRFSFLSPIATLLLEPFLCMWALVIGLVASCLIPVLPETAAFLFNAGALGLSAADGIAAWLAKIPFGSIWLPTPSWGEVFCFYILIIAILLWKRYKACRVLAGAAASVLVIVPLYYYSAGLLRNYSRVTFLDVGQGSSTLIEMPGGKTFLIDGGGSYSARFNVGENIIAPFLWHKRIAGLDGLIITHPHADHYNGLPFIVERFKPDTVWINGGREVSPEFGDLLDRAARYGADLRIPEPGEILHQEKNAALLNIGGLHLPDAAADPAFDKHLNNLSLVLHLDHGQWSFLFPGDIAQDAEAVLLRSHPDKLDVDVLLAPHHGSASSNSIRFLERVSPHYTIISMGRNHTGRYAGADVLHRYEKVGTKILQTNQCGAVTIKAGEAGLQASTYCSGD